MLSTWVPTTNGQELKSWTQVYGVCFTEDGKVLIIRKDEKWNIPGGKLLRKKMGPPFDMDVIRFLEAQEELGSSLL